MIESVVARQRGGYDFESHYENLCALQSSCPLAAIKAHLPEGLLDINGDRIRAIDWVPILNSIKINKSLNAIAIKSYFQLTFEEDVENVVVPAKRKTPAIRSKEITYRICKAMKECLMSTPALSQIELHSLPLRERDLTALAKGISKNNTLHHLSLEHSRIGDEGLEIVCKGVKNSQSVTSINFTGCSLTWKGAEVLAKIIKHQAMKRHNEAWQDSLRYRRPDLDCMFGIRRIFVNLNPMIGDQGATLLAEALKDDLWLKALDLQACGITVKGAQSLLDVLKYNTTIVVLDIRQNPLVDREIMQSIMEQVMINCSGQDTEYRWLKAEPPQDPSKVKTKKKVVKTLQNGNGKKAVIKMSGPVNGRKRSKSTGSVGTPLSGQRLSSGGSSEAIKVGIPWRTAMRACRYRGFPPDSPNKSGSKFGEEESSSFCSPTKTKLSPAKTKISEKPRAVELKDISIEGEDSSNSRRILIIEVEQLRRQLHSEQKSRQEYERRSLELEFENRRLKTQLSQFNLAGSSNVNAGNAQPGILDDDQILESIESSFRQFHAFLDLIREAGLGQLITLAGIDETSMVIPSRSGATGNFSVLAPDSQHSLESHSPPENVFSKDSRIPSAPDLDCQYSASNKVTYSSAVHAVEKPPVSSVIDELKIPPAEGDRPSQTVVSNSNIDGTDKLLTEL